MTDSETYNQEQPASGSHQKNDESFNGYANRETWAFNLHWQNDQGLYLDVLEYARQALAEAEEPEGVSDRALGELVVEYLDERTSVPYWADEVGVSMPELFWLMRDDVGSFWRVDPAEVGAVVRESLDAEGGVDN